MRTNTKTRLHPRSKHRKRYDFQKLAKSTPELTEYIRINDYGDPSIDFFDPKAILVLNRALLKHFYKVDYWELPEGYLCPPIPGRADYIHHIADLLRDSNKGKIPRGPKINCLDIGVGASYIYPILGIKEYGWSFVSSDIDEEAIISAQNISNNNILLKEKGILRLQSNPNNFFNNIIKKDERFDLSICNPPFHASQDEANNANLKKLKNLKKKEVIDPIKNFGGQSNELWCEGGEGKFIKNMITESKEYATSCFWYSTLISKKETVLQAKSHLHQANATDVKIIPMSQGLKSSRIMAWTFLTAKQQKVWAEGRWTL